MNDNNLPLVTVIVPCYNHEKFIEQCIESIINQTYQNFQLIVIDDGSTDNSTIILEGLKEKYNFTFVYQSNKGISYTLNRGIKEYAKGEYITFCASDDFWKLDKLQKQVEFLESNPRYVMCFGKMHYVDIDSKQIDHLDYLNNNLKGGNIFEDIILFKFHPPVNYMFRNQVFDDVGLYREDIKTEDFYMNLKIASKYPIGYIDDYLGFYRYFDLAKKIIQRHNTYESHEKCINEYINTPYYNQSLQIIRLGKIGLLSGYTVKKIEALKELIVNYRYFFKLSYIKAVIKLLVFWKTL